MGGPVTAPSRMPPVVTHRVELSLQTLLWAVAVVAACWVVAKLIPVLLVVVVALMLAGTLSPLVEKLEGRRVSRSLAIGLVFGALILLLVGFGALTLPPLYDQLVALFRAAPQHRDDAVHAHGGSPATAPLARSQRHLDYGTLATNATSTVISLSGRVFELVTYAVTTLFLALYVMIDRDRLRGALFAVVPREYHMRLSRVLLNMEVIVGGYIRGQLLTSFLLGLFTFLLLLACGVRDPLALAAIAALADLLPYIGVVLSIGPAAAGAYAQGPVVLAIVVIAMIIYEEIESRVLVPKIYGGTLKLPSSVVLVALLVGGTLGGIAGALLALPIAATLRMLIEELRVDLPGQHLDDTVTRERDDAAEEEYERRTEGAPAVVAASIAVEISKERRAEEVPGDRVAPEHEAAPDEK